MTVIRTKGHKMVKERKEKKNRGKTLYCKAAKTTVETTNIIRALIRNRPGIREGSAKSGRCVVLAGK